MQHRQRRRFLFPLAGAIAGGLAALVVAWLLNNLVSGHWEGGIYVGAAFVGVVGGFVLGMLLAAVNDDGEDDQAAYTGPAGRASTPVEGAEAQDAGRAARRPALRR